MGKKAE